MMRQCYRVAKIVVIFMSIFFALESSAASRFYGGELCAYDAFNCVEIKPGDTWAKLFPTKREREIVQRLNRTNVPLRYRHWIVVPTDMSQITLRDISPFPDTMDTEGEKLVVIDLKLQAFAAYNAQGQLVYWGPVSAGKGYCQDIGAPCNTITGSFRVTDKKGANCISKTFPVETSGGAPMPYCMNFYRGYAMHASHLPGYHASHGCVRLFYDDAKWLNQQFVEVGTRVIVSK